MFWFSLESCVTSLTWCFLSPKKATCSEIRPRAYIIYGGFEIKINRASFNLILLILVSYHSHKRFEVYSQYNPFQTQTFQSIFFSLSHK